MICEFFTKTSLNIYNCKQGGSVYFHLDNQAKNPNLFIILVHACKFYKKFCCTGWVQIIEHEPWTPFLIFSIYSITYV